MVPAVNCSQRAPCRPSRVGNSLWHAGVDVKP